MNEKSIKLKSLLKIEFHCIIKLIYVYLIDMYVYCIWLQLPTKQIPSTYCKYVFTSYKNLK